MSIRLKLFLFVLFGSILPILLIFFISFTQQKHHLQTSVEKALSSQATQSIKAINDRVKDARFNLSNFSELGVMQRVKSNDVFSLLKKDIENFSASHPIFTEITALNAEGDVIATTEEKMEGRNLAPYKEFREAINGQTYISFPEFSVRAGYYVSTQSHPIVSRSGEVVGVLVGLLNWSFLESYLSDDKVLGQEQSRNHVISVRSSVNGTQLYQSPGAQVSLSSTTKSSLNVLEDVVRDDMEYISLVVAPNDNENFSESTLLLHIFVDKEIAFSSIKLLTTVYGYIGAFVFTIVGVMWWLISQSIGNRIADLTQGARELTRGNFSYRIAQSKRSDEIAELAQSFDYMRHTIQGNEKKLIEKTQVAEQAAKLKGEFLANMSHEVRTPINGVLGMAELMLQTDMDPNQKRYASTILRSGQSLLSVINDILDFSKIEAGKLDITKAPFDLRDTVEDVAEMLAESAHRKQLELNIEMAPEEHTAYNGDAGRIRQVLVNLVSNAIKFTSSGEVTVKVSSFPKNDGTLSNIRIDVTDAGIGIPVDKHSRVFQEFEQADGTTTREYGGTGLGLAISKKLTKLMNGVIGFESVENQGSNFWFTVQLKPLPDSVQDRWASKQTLENRLILIVDDHQTNREILHDQLAHWGAQTIMANGAEHALQLIEDIHRQNQRIDVAIVDQQMPRMSGIQLIQKIEDIWPDNDTAFVVLSSVNEDRDLDSASALAAYSHITKPARQKDLYNCLAAVLNDDSAITAGSEYRKLQELQITGDVLLVEDNPVNQEMMMEMLKIMGVNVELAENGEEAVTRLAEKEFDLAFMDCQMPVMDGFEATSIIRSKESFDTTKRKSIIVALTANALEGDRERCLAAGMNDYLSKPVSTAELRQCLIKWIPDQASTKDDTTNHGVNTAESGDQNPEFSAPSDLPVIKQAVFQDVLKICEQASDGFYDTLVAKYIEGSEDDLQSIKSAILEGDSERVRTSSHRLKSSSANWGGERVADLCQKLESAGRDDDLSNAEALLDSLEFEVEQLIAQLNSSQRAA